MVMCFSQLAEGLFFWPSFFGHDVAANVRLWLLADADVALTWQARATTAARSPMSDI